MVEIMTNLLVDLKTFNLNNIHLPYRDTNI